MGNDKKPMNPFEPKTYEEILESLPERFPQPVEKPKDPNPFAGHFQRVMDAAPDLSMPVEQRAHIAVAEARRQQLQGWLADRRPLFEGRGITVDLEGLEVLRLEHRSCGNDWRVPVAAGMPVLACPFCQPGGR